MLNEMFSTKKICKQILTNPHCESKGHNFETFWRKTTWRINLVNKNSQAKAPHMFSALGPTASKTVIASHGLLFSRNVGKPYTDQSILLVFFDSIWKENTHKPSKAEAAKNFFFGVYVVGIICYDECFLFHVMTGRHFFIKVSR